MQVRYQLRQRPRSGQPYHQGRFPPRPAAGPAAGHTTGRLPTIAPMSHGEDASPLEGGPAAARASTDPVPDLERHLEKVAVDGYTILPNVIEPDLTDEINETLLALEHDRNVVPSSNRFEGVRTTRIYNLLVHGAPFDQIPVHPHVLPVVEGVLDPGLLISSLSSIAIGPDEDAQPLHADDQLIPLPRPHVPIICNTMWAITDFTEDNGATRLVPGSHLNEEAPDVFQTYPTVAAEMEKGSVLVWVGSLWHGGGANHTGSRRVGIAMNYCAGYIRQQENQQLGLPTTLVRTFPRRLQELIGYSVYNGLVGHIDKQHPAKVVLAQNEGVDMVWDALKI
jgi:ectoine hydroxylase-related dioxygenase (phytanoyl-CoA dioxygenase family)